MRIPGHLSAVVCDSHVFRLGVVDDFHDITGRNGFGAGCSGYDGSGGADQCNLARGDAQPDG
jgi:hypothetical protein